MAYRGPTRERPSFLIRKPSDKEERTTIKYWKGGKRGQYHEVTFSSHDQYQDHINNITKFPKWHTNKRLRNEHSGGGTTPSSYHKTLHQKNYSNTKHISHIDKIDIEHDAQVLYAWIIHEYCQECANHEEKQKNNPSNYLEFDWSNNESELFEYKKELKTKLETELKTKNKQEIETAINARIIIRSYCQQCIRMVHVCCRDIKHNDEFLFEYPSHDDLTLLERHNPRNMPKDDRKIFWIIDEKCKHCQYGILFMYYFYIFYIFLLYFLHISLYIF